MFRNGVPSAAGSLNFSNFDDLWLGFEPPGNSLDADLANLRISDGLRYTEVFEPDASMSADADTLAFWPGNDGSGTVVEDVAGGHDARFIGATAWSSECLPLEVVLVDGDDDDSACAAAVESPEISCDDGCDNDGNGLTDCQDLDSCVADPVCDPETLGNDGSFNGPATQSGPGVDMPLCCEPDPATGDPTCTTCIEALAPPPLGCGDDPTGWTPTAHILQEGSSACCEPFPPWGPACLECQDGLDNDGDGDIDCDDAGCIAIHAEIPSICP
jgi:hypothetical protein